jgi:hypothetical protein
VFKAIATTGHRGSSISGRKRDSSSSVQVADASVVLAKQLYLARLVGVRDAIIDGPLGLCPPDCNGNGVVGIHARSSRRHDDGNRADDHQRHSPH